METLAVEVRRFAPCPTCHCRKRVLDEEDGVQTLRCLECGEEIRMTARMSQPVRLRLQQRRAQRRRPRARVRVTPR